jgi:hypothetical protein
LIERRAGNRIRVDLAVIEPDLELPMRLDRYAPRIARHRVAQVDSPSPDLRDAVVLLTSELVTRAFERCRAGVGEELRLRVWMPPEVVRVEVQAPRMLLGGCVAEDELHFERLLFGHLADRWAVEREEGARSTMWFEIDRVQSRVASPA